MLSRCMTGNRRAPADKKILGFYDIRTHFRNPERRTIVIKVPRENDECKSGYAVLEKAMERRTQQCFDAASENAMTAMGFDTGVFSPSLYRSGAVHM